MLINGKKYEMALAHSSWFDTRYAVRKTNQAKVYAVRQRSKGVELRRIGLYEDGTFHSDNRDSRPWLAPKSLNNYQQATFFPAKSAADEPKPRDNCFHGMVSIKGPWMYIHPEHRSYVAEAMAEFSGGNATEEMFLTRAFDIQASEGGYLFYGSMRIKLVDVFAWKVDGCKIIVTTAGVALKSSLIVNKDGEVRVRGYSRSLFFHKS